MMNKLSLQRSSMEIRVNLSNTFSEDNNYKMITLQEEGGERKISIMIDDSSFSDLLLTIRNVDLKTPLAQASLWHCIQALQGDKGIIRVLPVYGGQSMSLQLRHLRNGVEVVVGTPGRVMDHLQKKSLKIDKIRYFVLDEADEMLNM